MSKVIKCVDMLTKLSIRLFLFVSLYGAVYAHPTIRELTEKFGTAPTHEVADAAARDVTNYLLDPAEAKFASPEEEEETDIVKLAKNHPNV